MKPRLVRVCDEINCFYYEAIIGLNEAVWRDQWCHKRQDVVPVAHCPSCQVPLAELSYPDDFPFYYSEMLANGKIQTKFQTNDET